MVRGSKGLCGSNGIHVRVRGMWGPRGGGGKPEQEEGKLGTPFFSLISEVTRGGRGA